MNPDYYRENDDRSLDYYDSRAELYYPVDEPQRPQPQHESEDEE